jgi:co-chaperonin GroES (HSP10)
MTAATRLKEYADDTLASQRAKELKAKKERLTNKGNIDANLTDLATCGSSEEQKEVLLAKLGDLSGQQPLGCRVLVATYVGADRSAGGILFTDKRKDAARYEGKVGLVLAVGPTAFRYDGAFPWEGPTPQVGQWVWYRASDGPERWIRHVSCRTISDDLIEGITTDPTAIY